MYLGVKEENCAAYGTMNGRTVSFTTAVYCEMLRAYTVTPRAPHPGSERARAHSCCFLSEQVQKPCEFRLLMWWLLNFDC